MLGALEQELYEFNQPFFNTTKRKIIILIGKFPGLNCSQIVTILRRSGTNISNQAVYKTLKQLSNEKVLNFNETNKKYYINKTWLEQAKKFIENANTKKETTLIII